MFFLGEGQTAPVRRATVGRSVKAVEILTESFSQRAMVTSFAKDAWTRSLWCMWWLSLCLRCSFSSWFSLGFIFIQNIKNKEFSFSYNIEKLFSTSLHDSQSGANIQKSLSSTYQKIFLNYLQMMSISKLLDLKWQQSLLSFFKISESVSGSFISVMNLECLLKGNIYYLLSTTK